MNSQIAQLLPLLLILAVFYFLIIRPTRSRQRQAVELQSRLAPGQEVMTTSGMYATVRAVEDDRLVLETAPGVTSRWTRSAVARIVTPVDVSARPGRVESSPTGSAEEVSDAAPQRDEQDRREGSGGATAI